jgi:hypothetical protein
MVRRATRLGSPRIDAWVNTGDWASRERWSDGGLQKARLSRSGRRTRMTELVTIGIISVVVVRVVLLLGRLWSLVHAQSFPRIGRAAA